MSSSSNDGFSSERASMLEQFKLITSIDNDSTAREWLESHQWNIEKAIETVFSGDSNPTDIVDVVKLGAGPSTGSSSTGEGLRRRNVVQNESAQDTSTKALQPVSTTTEVTASGPGVGLGANRIRKGTRSPMTMLQILLYPATLAFRIVWVLLSFVASIFPFSLIFASRQRASAQPPASRDPQSTAARFLLDYEAQYGSVHPAFFQGTYSQALEVCKRELRCLLVILHSEEHDDTETFCRETLASPVLLDFLREKRFVVWGGDIRESEAFVVSNTLLTTRYPFLAVIAPQGTSRMVVVDRFEGPMNAVTLVQSLQVLLDRVEGVLRGVREDRQRHEQARLLREQQEEAYNASLRADQEKARKAQEERNRLAKEAELEQLRLQEIDNIREAKRLRKEKLRESLSPEPASDDTVDIAKISIRLPNGERLIRRFKATSATVQNLYDFIETHELGIPLESDFEVINAYPRAVLTAKAVTLKEAGLYPSGSVMIEEVDPE